MPRRPVILLVLATMAVAVLVPVLLLLVQPADTSGVRAQTPSPAVSLAAASSPRPPEGPVDPTADAAWWRIDPRAADGAPIVVIGTLEHGETASIELRTRPTPPGVATIGRPHQRVLGPVGGRVILIEEVGPESVLSVVDAATGAVHELYSSTDLVIDGGVVGEDLVFLTANELDGSPIGLWRVNIAAGGEPEAIPGLIEARHPFTTVAVVDWITELVVGVDGSTVAIHRCVRLGCELRGLDLATGETWRTPLDFGSGPVAIVGGLVLLEPICVDVDCRLELLDPATGVLRPAPGSPDRQLFEATVVLDSRPILVTMRSGPVVAPGAGPVQLELLDLETMTFAPLAVDLGSLALMGRFGNDAAIELEPGTLLVVGSERARNGEIPVSAAFYVVDLASGEAVHVPQLGEVFIQG